MKKIFFMPLIQGMVIILLFSCKKENIDNPASNPSVQVNHPPVANAGSDQTINLPTNTIALDGSGSSDPENNISNYRWTKISGPSSFDIVNANAGQTQVNNLVEGNYQFELKVTDGGGLFSKDTVEVRVTDASLQANTIIFNDLYWNDDAINKMARTQTFFLSNGYSVNNIKAVYLYSAPLWFSSVWFGIQKEGNQIYEIYYKTNSSDNSLFAFWRYDGNYPPDYVSLVFAPYKMKIEFL